MVVLGYLSFDSSFKLQYHLGITAETGNGSRLESTKIRFVWAM